MLLKTTTALTSILLCLAKNAAKQEKLRTEIMQLLPEKNSLVNAASMKNLPYLRACIKEALRIFPVGPGLIRTTPKDMVLRGHKVPKGTDITVITFLMLEDPDFYPNPKEFLPERWLRSTNDNKAKSQCEGKNAHPFAYIPFGFGPRTCVGKRIVDMELEIGVAKIIRNFQVEFNYPTDNIFKNVLINVPDKPLQFKFSDL